MERSAKPRGNVPVHLDVAEHVLLLERAALEGQAQALAHHAVRAVGADQIARAHGLSRSDSVRVTPSASWSNPASRDAALHRAPSAAPVVAQDGLGLVLRDADEAERHIVGKRQRDLPGPHSVDVDELAMKSDGGVQDAPQHAHVLEHLERTGLHANGFRVKRRLDQRVDEPAAIPRRASSIAAVRPMGPAPAMRRRLRLLTRGDYAGPNG